METDRTPVNVSSLESPALGPLAALRIRLSPGCVRMCRQKLVYITAKDGVRFALALVSWDHPYLVVALGGSRRGLE